MALTLYSYPLRRQRRRIQSSYGCKRAFVNSGEFAPMAAFTVTVRGYAPRALRSARRYAFKCIGFRHEPPSEALQDSARPSACPADARESCVLPPTVHGCPPLRRATPARYAAVLNVRRNTTNVPGAVRRRFVLRIRRSPARRQTTAHVQRLRHPPHQHRPPKTAFKIVLLCAVIPAIKRRACRRRVRVRQHHPDAP